MSTMHWGDVPGWIGALSTLGAAIGAVVIGVRLWRLEADRDMRDAADRDAAQAEGRREQAVLVTGWYGPKVFENKGGVGMIFPPTSTVYGGMVRNGSEAPVHDIRVGYHFRSLQVNDGTPTAERGYEDCAVIPPGETVFLRLPDDVARNVDEKDPYTISFTFRDAHNRRWRRDVDGSLTEQ